MVSPSSAGGTGVLLNVDRVARLLALKAPQVLVLGLADSGWFLDNKQFRRVASGSVRRKREYHKYAPTEVVSKGIQ